MANPANPAALAQQARKTYIEGLLGGLPAVVQAIDHGAKMLLSQTAEHGLTMRRRDLVEDMKKAVPFWQQGMIAMSAQRTGQWRRLRHAPG